MFGHHGRRGFSDRMAAESRLFLPDFISCWMKYCNNLVCIHDEEYLGIGVTNG